MQDSESTIPLVQCVCCLATTLLGSFYYPFLRLILRLYKATSLFKFLGICFVFSASGTLRRVWMCVCVFVCVCLWGGGGLEFSNQ